MKKHLAILLVLVLMAALPLAASADVPAPGGPFDTAFRIQNLGTDAANCSFKFYDASGVQQYDSGALAPIPVGDSAFIYVPTDTTVGSGQYAGVVECDQEVAAVVNFADADSGASYSGVADPATTLYAPGIYDNYYTFYSNIVVQNAHSAAQDITVEIYEPGNSTPVKVQTASAVPMNGYATFEQEGLPELDDDQFYSAKIIGEAPGNIAAIVNIYGRGGSDNQLYSYNPFAAGSTEAYAPVIMDTYYGYNTALVIQNLGGVAANVTITYSDGTVKNASIAPGAADSRYTPTEGLGSGLYSAQVECTNGQPIVVLVNESSGYNRAASYSGFASGTLTVRAPIVMKRYYGYNTSITCQNVGTAAATMAIEYAGIAGSTTSPSIPVNGIHLFYQPSEVSLSDGWIGSATITSAEPIVCIVNEDMNEPPESTQFMDQLYAYNGIGQ
jgi:hypothetical protein